MNRPKIIKFKKDIAKKIILYGLNSFIVFKCIMYPNQRALFKYINICIHNMRLQINEKNKN